MKRGIFAAPMTTVTADDKILAKFCSLSPPEMPLFMGQLGLPGPYGPREAPKKGKGHNGGDVTLRVTVGIADAVARSSGQPLRFAPRPLLRSACPTI